MQVGQFVRCKAGRDKGKSMLVYRIIDEQYVLLVDGKLRPLSKPKRKKIMHIQTLCASKSQLLEKINDGKLDFDHLIRKEIQSIQVQVNANKGGLGACQKVMS